MLTNFPVDAKAPAAAAVLEGTDLVQGYFNYTVGARTLSDLSSLWWGIVSWRPQIVVYLAAFRGAASVRRDSRFFSLCGIRRQIGVPLIESMQTHLLRDGEQALEPEASRLLRNLGELGKIDLDDPASWDLRITTAEIARAEKELQGAAGLPVIAVSVGTKMQAKDWGVENWRGLLEELPVRFPGYALVLCGAAEEAEASKYAASGWRSAGAAPVLNLCGRLTPRESAAVFSKARIFVGHDSGPMHLAAAVQTPCVAIFAARNKPRVWFPYGREHRVVYHQVDCWGCNLETCVVERKRCILSITVAEVLAEIELVLKGNS